MIGIENSSNGHDQAPGQFEKTSVVSGFSRTGAERRSAWRRRQIADTRQQCYPAIMERAERLKRRATNEDLLDVPDHLVAEIVDGELFTTPRPALRHAQASSTLGGELFAPFHLGRGGPGGWLILDEPELHLRADIVVPDLAGWRRTRLATVPDEPFLELSPDWVCEIVSPSTERFDRVKKLDIYARESVGHVWLINPIARTLEVYRLDAGQWLRVGTYGDDQVVHAVPFDVLALDLLVLWGEERPSSAP
jgi:Uma2 family endonuclease